MRMTVEKNGSQGAEKPYAYCIYIAAEQRGELVYDLEDAMDDLTNCECEITELFDHPPASAAQVPSLSDAELLSIADEFRSEHEHCMQRYTEFDEIGFARAVIAALSQQGDAK